MTGKTHGAGCALQLRRGLWQAALPAHDLATSIKPLLP